MAKCICNRCGYNWESQLDSPRKCANCRTLLWNQPRKYKLKLRPDLSATSSRLPPCAFPSTLHGVSLQDLLEVLREVESEFSSYSREIRALKSIVKDAFKH